MSAEKRAEDRDTMSMAKEALSAFIRNMERRQDPNIRECGRNLSVLLKDYFGERDNAIILASEVAMRNLKYVDEIARLDRELAHANRRIDKLIDALKPGRKTLSAGEKLRIWKKSVLANGIRRKPDGQ